jgi:stress-induced morphogen
MAQERLKRKIEKVLREELLGAEGKVVIQHGFEDFLHVYILSERFKGKRLREKGDMIWSVLSRHLSPNEWGNISLTMGLAPGEKNGLLSFEYEKLFGE